MDRALDFGSSGCGFEPCLVRFYYLQYCSVLFSVYYILEKLTSCTVWQRVFLLDLGEQIWPRIVPGGTYPLLALGQHDPEHRHKRGIKLGADTPLEFFQRVGG